MTSTGLGSFASPRANQFNPFKIWAREARSSPPAVLEKIAATASCAFGATPVLLPAHKAATRANDQVVAALTEVLDRPTPDPAKVPFPDVGDRVTTEPQT